MATRAGRHASETAATITLTHDPTGVAVSGAIAAGNYSRSEMIRRKSQLRRELTEELRLAVAKHLRVSGR